MRKVDLHSRRDFGKAAAVGLAGLSNLSTIPNLASPWPAAQAAATKSDKGSAGEPEPFVDWYEIWPGATAYEKDGRAWVSEAPQGVKLSVQTPEKSPPVLVADQPWEWEVGAYGNVLYEEGRYRMWYGVRGKAGQTGSVCYAESTNGFQWRKPRLGLHDRDGSTANNVVYPKAIEGMVFRDPSGPDAERYKLISMEGSAEYQGKVIRSPELEQVVKELEKKGVTPADIYGKELRLLGEVVGAVSPDGLRWTRIPEPLFRKFCDTQNVVWYDPGLKKYVGYWRTGYGGRRSIARSETDNFRRWPQPTMVLQPDLQDSPSDDYYTNAYCRYPTGKVHLMFPAIYRRTRDLVDIQIAVSRDGLNWAWPERRAIIPPGGEGSGETGSLYANPGLLPLDNGRWGLLYWSSDERHNEAYYYPEDPKVRPGGKFRWAIWKRDRLVALEAEGEGRVTLNKRMCQGERMLLNYQTARNGWLRAELIEPTLWPPAHVEPLKGFSFAECEPLRGDSLAGEFRWNGSADLSRFKGRILCVRIELCRAKLFSIAGFSSADRNVVKPLPENF